MFLDDFDSPTSPLRSGIILLVVLFTVGLCLVGTTYEVSTKPGVIMYLPTRVLDFIGYEQEISEGERAILPPDTEFARKSYENFEGDTIIASIILSGAEKRSIHRPEICLPAQGWQNTGSRRISIPLKSGRQLEVTALSIMRPLVVGPKQTLNIRGYYLYWFVGDGMTTPSHFWRVFHTSWDKVFHNINHRWAYVIAYSIITQDLRPDGKNPEQTLSMLTDFVREIVPHFQISEMENTKPDEVPPAANSASQ
ncbi:MAG: EpsI family protein [Methylacidiphilales bacterium]|nr:EpsI family protein [Candidatus Methylacidiphilales bacterium]MDW8349129.1 exosortase-associated EpsI family protein [Verrucomicrobiae bacterium]